MAQLTKKFWSQTAEQYPKAYKMFSAWLVEYKKANQWLNLFNNTAHKPAPKFYGIPDAMQIGIIIEFVFDLAVEQLEINNPFGPRAVVENLFKAIDEMLPDPPDNRPSEEPQINGH